MCEDCIGIHVEGVVLPVWIFVLVHVIIIMVELGCFSFLGIAELCSVNPLKPSGVKWSHYKDFRAILVQPAESARMSKN